MTPSIHPLLRWAAHPNLLFGLAAILIPVMAYGTVTGSTGLYHHPAFTALLVLLGINTSACVATRWREVRLSTVISHVGILVILAGALVTAIGGLKGSLALRSGEPATDAVEDGDGHVFHLPFRVRLAKFELEYHRPPRHVLRLTHRRQKWTKPVEVEIGKTVTVPGTSVRVTAKRFVPDFMIDHDNRTIVSRSSEPRNPALQVSVSGSRDFWVFEAFPGMHQEDLPIAAEYAYEAPAVKQFNSDLVITDEAGKTLREERIWVNKPLRHGGFTFYQSSYDPEDLTVSVLQVSKDPGVGVVYAGFLILLVGLTLNLTGRKNP